MIGAAPGNAQPAKRLLVTGSLAYDYILGYPGHLQVSLVPLHQRDRCNITLEASQMERHPGGCGGNIAYTLALMGEQPRLLSIAGSDIAPYRHQLEKVGVDLDHVREIPDELTASCVILTDSMQNRVVAFYGGATDRASELDLKAALDSEIAAIIIAPDDVPGMLTFAEAARASGLPFIFDIGSQAAAMDAQQIATAVQGARVLVCNDYEMSIVQTKTGWSLEQLLEQVPVVAVTCGEHGSLLYQSGVDPIAVAVVALRTPPVDSTGAGDAYRAGFSYGWVRAWPLEVCGRLGSCAAAFVLEARGTQGHFFTMDDFWERYLQCYGELPGGAHMKSAHSAGS